MPRRTYTAQERRTIVADARRVGAAAAASAHGVPRGTVAAWLRADAQPATYDPALLVAAAGCSLRTLAARLGVDPAILCRPLSERQADRYATALDLHPSEVWR